MLGLLQRIDVAPPYTAAPQQDADAPQRLDQQPCVTFKRSSTAMLQRVQHRDEISQITRRTSRMVSHGFRCGRDAGVFLSLYLCGSPLCRDVTVESPVFLVQLDCLGSYPHGGYLPSCFPPVHCLPLQDGISSAYACFWVSTAPYVG